jgi:hypothetical protein
MVIDASGSAIKDTKWHKGPAKVTAAGSDIQLPDSTIYKNTDFTTDYLAYQYRVTNEQDTRMRDWTPITFSSQITESGSSLKVEARAATAAITGDANRLLGGPAASAVVSLDFLPPESPVVTAHFTKEYQTYLYTITHIYDADSGVAASRLLEDGSLVNDSVEENINTTFTATEADITAGKYAIGVTDNVGFETVKIVSELPEDMTPPVTDPGDNSSTAFIANNERNFTINASDPDSYVYSTTVTIDGRQPFTPQPQQVDHTVTYQFKLSDIIKNPQDRIGWHQMIITSTNVKGLTQQNDTYFLVNPGPTEGTLTSDGDYASKYSDSPVVITAAFNPEIVPEARFTKLDGTKFIGPAVTVKSMSYGIMQNNSQPPVNQFKVLGSYKFRVDKEGNNRVYLRLVDSLGMDNLGNGSVIPQVNVNIDYKQKRY